MFFVYGSVTINRDWKGMTMLSRRCFQDQYPSLQYEKDKRAFKRLTREKEAQT